MVLDALRKRLLSKGKKKNKRQRRQRALGGRLYIHLERLEERNLLAVRIWDGGGANNLWSNPVNWDAAVLPGDDLQFPSGAMQLVNSNDFPNGTIFNSITFNGLLGGYDLTGNFITLNNGVTAAQTVGSNDISLAILANGNQTFTTTSALATLQISGGVSLQGNLTVDGAGTTEALASISEVIAGQAVTKIGTGELTLAAVNTFSGPTNLQAGNLTVNGTLSFSNVNQTGGLLAGSGLTRTVATTAGAIGPGDAAPGILTANGPVMLGNGTLNVELNGTVVGAQYDQLDVAGNVTLSNATLNASVGFASAPGDSFVIIDNHSANPVNGIFNGLPENTVFTVGLQAFRITYVGGTGNDVVLTRVADVTVNGTAADDLIRVFRDSGDPSILHVTVNGAEAPGFPQPLAAVAQITLNGLVGNDSFVIDTSNGLITVPNGIRVDGATGFDKLTIEQPTSATVQTSQVLGVGATSGSGQDTLTGPSGVQTVFFQNLEPLYYTVPVASFTITSVPALASLLQASNAINYTASTDALNPGGGTITVDQFERIEFNNRDQVIIRAGAGDDVININNPTRPAGSTPGGLKSILVDAADPTASDKVVVNGRVNLADVITAQSSVHGDGTVTFGAASNLPTVNIIEAELLVVNGQGGGDEMQIQTLNGSHTVRYTPGPDIDSGSVRIDATTGHLPIDFKGLGTSGLVRFIVDPDTTVSDALIINGTATSDIFTVDGTAGSIQLQTQLSFNPISPIFFPGIRRLTLNGLDGDDRFNFTGPLTAFNTGVLIDGGNPSTNSDTLSLTGTAGVENVTLNFTTKQITGFGADVDFTGVEHVILNSGGGADTFAVTGTGADDLLTFALQSLGGGLLTNGDALPDVQYSGFTGGLSVNGINGFDTLGLRGTSGNDRFDVVQPAAGQLNATLNGFTQPFTFTSIEAARIESLAGDDLIRVTVADALVATPALSLPFDVDGGPPNASDRLVVVDDGLGDLVVQRKSQDNAAGSIAVGPLAPVTYVNTERIDVTPLNAITNGTGTDGLGRLVVFKHDPNELNDTLATATFLGSGATLNVDPTIDPAGDTQFNVPGDQDWYRFVAAETGTLDIQIHFQTIPTLANGRAGLPGNGALAITAFDSDGLPAAIGTATALLDPAGNTIGQRITLPVVRNQTYHLRVQGAVAEAVNNYSLTAINITLPIPQTVDLQAASDSGRHNDDNVTNRDAAINAAAAFDIILDDDRIDEFTNLNLAPDNVANDARDNDYGVEVFNNGVSIGFASFVSGNRWVFTATAGDLQEGPNNFISAAVWVTDRGNPAVIGRGLLSTPLKVTLDTIAPAAPTVALDASSDTAHGNTQATLTDRITNRTNPGFVGTAEADAIVRLWADGTPISVGIDGSDVFQGLTVAVPLDGNNAFPLGQWNLIGSRNLNDATAGFPLDGVRQISATAEDLAGNESPRATPGTINIFIDTQGPQIVDPDASHNGIHITDDPGTAVDESLFDLFDVKPSQGPTPLVKSLTIHFQDLPNRDTANFPAYLALLEAVAEDPGAYQVRGDHNGIIPIQSVVFTAGPDVNGQPATATVVLTFANPLPDDRFTISISDSLIDPAGNHLDGESNAAQPQGNPTFPSGNFVAGGSFVARFTVDSRPEIGSVSAGTVYIDTNGNFLFDPQNLDAVNRDITYVIGFTSDAIFAGNFVAAPAGVADGFDKLAAYGFVAGSARWIIDTNNDGVADINVVDPAGISGLPVAGNFDGNAANGDEVGIFDGTRLWRDTDHDFRVNGAVTTVISGYPVVGDFDGDGLDDLATWRDDRFYFDLASNGFGQLDGSISFGFLGVRERPVAADMNKDGIDDLGLWVPDRSGAAPDEMAEWFFLISRRPNDVAITGTLLALNHPFTPTPLGVDLYAQYGDQWGVPIVGNFDPPVTPASSNSNSQNNTTPPTNTSSSNLGSSNSGSSNSGSSNSNTPPSTPTTSTVTPSISIDDASISEGTGGAKSLTFTVRLSAATTNTVTVRYGTANGTAMSTKDYTTVAGTLTFAPGITEQQIVVPITTDNIDELDETFVVNLKKPSKATLADSQAVGTIIDDDAAPVVSIDNVSVNEGDSGRTNAVFTVSLSNPSSQTVKVQYATVDGTAGSSDYRALSARTIAFGPGVVSQKITVQVNGDRVAEGDETFTVQLLSAVAASIGTSFGTGTILDNDSASSLLLLPAAAPQNAPAGEVTTSTATTNPPASSSSQQSSGPSLAESLAAPKLYGPRRPSSSAAAVQDISLMEYLQGLD